MCYQTVYQHQCSHTVHGSLSTCGTPSVLGHHTSRIVQGHPGPCYVCAGRVSYHGLNSYRAPAIIPFPAAVPLQASIAPSIAIASIPTPFSQPLPYSYSPTYGPQQPFFQAGNVPAWIPRDVRYEMIRGTLVPVEHFSAIDVGMDRLRGWNPTYGYDTAFPIPGTSKHGWNPIHGFDSGAPPPGLGNPANAPKPVFGDNAAIANAIHGIRDLAQSAPRDLTPDAEDTQRSEQPSGSTTASGASSRVSEPSSTSGPETTLQSGISDTSTSTTRANSSSEMPLSMGGENGEDTSNTNSQPAKKAKKVKFADNVATD